MTEHDKGCIKLYNAILDELKVEQTELKEKLCNNFDEIGKYTQWIHELESEDEI